MNEWCINQHGKTGLTQRVRESQLSEREAEQQTIAFIADYVDQGASPMCGNSIGQDRRFLHRYMPELEAYFHYRNLDVSSIKELARRWKPEVLTGFTKQGTHLALDDIRDSIAELQHYRENFFNV
jgi:oligoribonuclease